VRHLKALNRTSRKEQLQVLQSELPEELHQLLVSTVRAFSAGDEIEAEENDEKLWVVPLSPESSSEPETD